MPDRDKVIKALEICEKKDCVLCPYTEWCGEYDDSYFYDCTKLLAKDALALLKEQEAVEPKTEPSAKGYWFTCGVCGWWLFEVRDTVHFDSRKRIRYCASCGQAVKWNA